MSDPAVGTDPALDFFEQERVHLGSHQGGLVPQRTSIENCRNFPHDAFGNVPVDAVNDLAFFQTARIRQHRKRAGNQG
jgi:hypothetical protein